jgi:hypothetical protein
MDVNKALKKKHCIHKVKTKKKNNKLKQPKNCIKKSKEISAVVASETE